MATPDFTYIIRYVPTLGTGINMVRGNITYIYVRVNGTNCVADACGNMLNNSGFETGGPNDLSQAAFCGPLNPYAWCAHTNCWTQYT